MISLILAIACSSLISIIMRISEPKVKNNMVMLAGNYLICGALSLFFVLIDGGESAFSAAESVTSSDWLLTVILGIINGILYLSTLWLLQFTIQKSGMVLASTFMKLGVIVPVIFSIIMGWDRPTVFQFIGCGLAIIAILVINVEKKKMTPSPDDGPTAVLKKKGFLTAGLWLLILLVTCGISDSFANVIDKSGASSLKNVYLLILFVTAMLSAVLMAFIKKQKFNGKDFLWGLLLGVPNYFSSRFFLLALGDLPSIIVYPVFNIAALLVISVIGFLVFKEKISRQKLCGILIILVAILMLNLK